MANRDMKLDVLISLKDRFSSALGKLTSNINRATSAMRKIGAVGAIIGAISFMGPLNEAAAFQQQLIDIAGTAELTGASAFKFVEEAKTKYEAMALEIGQTSNTIAAGAGKMIAAGLDVSQVHASIRDIGVAATAANASFDDMSGVATSMMLNLKVPASDVRDSLGALVVAGKLGSFELKDMAKEFPNLTSQVAKFGVTGREAVNFLGSGLQIAMKGASETSVAANNFSNFLAKALAPRTVKNFEKMGVDIQAVMQDAATKGINPLEAILQKVQKLTGVSQTEIDGYMKKAKANGLEGAEALGYVRQQLEKIGAAGKISELFNDQQVLDFLVPMMANIDEFKTIKEQVAKATGSMTDQDFDTQMQGINVQKRILGELGTQISREWGLAFGAWLPMINSNLTSMLKRFRELDASTGGWLKKALVLGAGAVLLATAIGAVGLALPLVMAGLSAIGAIIGVVLSPIGLLIGLLAGAGVMIWQNWDKIAPKLSAFWGHIKDTGMKAWSGIKGAWSKMSPYMSELWSRMSRDAGRAWTWLEQKGGAAWGTLKNQAQGAFGGINWDNVGIKFLEGYDAVINGLGKAFEFLGEIWDGFAPSIANIAESFKSGFGSLGGVWENLKGLASGLGELAVSIGKMLGIGNEGGTSFGNLIGKILGFIGQVAAGSFAVAADVLHIITGALRMLVDILNGKTPDWKNYFPDWLVGFVNKLGAGIDKIKAGLEWISGNGSQPLNPNLPILDGMQLIPSPNAQAANSNIPPNTYGLSGNGYQTLPSPLEQAKKDPFFGYKTGNDFAVPSKQKIELGKAQVDVKVQVQGGGTATATVTQTQAPSVSSDGGRAVGRN